MTPLLWVLFVVNLMGYFFLVSWMPTLLASASDPGKGASLATAILQVGGFIGGVGDRNPARSSRPGAGRGAVRARRARGRLDRFLAQQSLLGLMIVVFLAGICALGTQFGINAVSAIIYPTALRSTGSGACFGIGRVGGILGPVVGGWLIGKHLPVQQLYMAATIPFIVGAIVAIIMMPMFAQHMRTVGPGR